MSASDRKKPLHLNAYPADYTFVPGLNGLRAVSIMVVLIGHFILPKSLEGFSALGVFIFFSISGFLITRLLFAEHKKAGAVNIPAFFFRRYLRLYPVILVYLGLFISIYLAQGKAISSIDILSVVFYFTNYLNNYYMIHGGTFTLPIGPLWSLAVEEHFYLIMPLVFVAVKGRARPVAIFAAAILALSLLVRCLYVTVWPEIIGIEYVYRPSETRFDSIAVGVLLAALCEIPEASRWIERLSSRKALGAALVLLFFAFAYKGVIYGDTLRYSVRNFACVLLVSCTVFGRDVALLQRAANNVVADWIGRISYSLYIWHCGAWYFGSLVGVTGDGPIKGLVYVAMTFIAATISFYFIEQPVLKLRKSARPLSAVKAI